MEPQTTLRTGRRSPLGKHPLLGIGIGGGLLLALFAFASRPGVGSSLLSLWLPLLLRWAHLIYGFAWIGASFYFIFVENRLDRFPTGSKLAGRLWTVHGGGVYRLEKYRTAPDPLPTPLHWFRWDAYLTWLTGFALLVSVFYSHPEATLIDPQVARLSPGSAILWSLAILAGGWLIYSGLCTTPLLHHPPLFALFSCLLLAALSFGLTHLYSGRGAFLHLGAVLGTIMAGNVLFVIIPSQRRFLQAARRGENLDPAQVERTHLRSLHNNYLAFPVLFTMMSGHFPFAFLGKANWLVLFFLLLAGGTVRHGVNLRQRRKPWLPWMAGGAAFLFGAIALAQPESPVAPLRPTPREASGAEVEAILLRRCAGCHAEKPTLAHLQSPPARVILDSLAGLERALLAVREQAIHARAMPPGNYTGMTEEERSILEQWIQMQEVRTRAGVGSHP
ncbi:MAG: urate hydroxylase PuuD [Methylacidiphilaceae bacterium]|nr:urate hydroxylase PuuD [Candidatus Methylacidiphilaceae bacterium]